MKYFLRVFILTWVFSLFVSRAALAVWWNPSTWQVFKKVPQAQTQKIDPAAEIEKLRKEVEDLKKKTSPVVTPSVKDKPITTTKPKVVASKLVSLTNAQIISRVKPAVVYIETGEGSGSGMIFSSDGNVLTNAHVVKGYTNVDVAISNGQTLPGRVIGRDEAADLAVVKINSGQQFTKIEFADSEKTAQGDEVFALGFPFGIKGDVSFKEGTISRRIEGYFETSAEIHPGNSGGPLVNRYGQVVGVNTAIYGKSVRGIQLGETIKLAIPIKIAKALIADLQSGRNVVVESKEEKAVKQQVEDEKAKLIRRTEREKRCETQTEDYYNRLVSGVEQVYGRNDPELQSLISQIQHQIEGIKRDLADHISRATSNNDRTIAELRSSAETQIQGIRTTALRVGKDISLTESQIASVNDKLNQDIAYYESQKQGQIASGQLLYGDQIQKYEALKSRAYADHENNRQDALEKAKINKTEYFKNCVEL